jgi:Polyketide cyclase / dehydrase and lipid transport
MGTLKRSGRVETVTDASPEQVWDAVADVTPVGEWSHECRTAVWLDGASAAVPGARFGGSNRLGRLKWSRVDEIVTAEAPHELVWRTVPSRTYPDSTEWRIRIEPEGEWTRIVQTFEVSSSTRRWTG